MIRTQTQQPKTLNIIATNTNKALLEVVKDLSQKELSQFSQTKDLATILNTLLKESSTQKESQNQALLNLLKNNPTFKDLGNVTKTLESLELLFTKSDLKETSQKEPLKQLQSLLKDLSSISHNADGKTLQNKLQNSGIFLESQLKNVSTDQELERLLSQDLKANLLTAKDTLQQSELPFKNEFVKQIDKLLLQIDYYQLLSHLTNETALFIPYAFEMLEGGNIKLKKAKNRSFFCDIELLLKEYGALHVRLGLFDEKELNINIECQDEQLQNLLEANLPELRENLFSVGLYPKSITFVKKEPKQDLYKERMQDIQLGFEVKA
jgi:hypothetical protein